MAVATIDKAITPHYETNTQITFLELRTSDTQKLKRNTCPCLPVEIWITIVTWASNSFKELTEYTRIFRLLWNVYLKPTTKARAAILRAADEIGNDRAHQAVASTWPRKYRELMYFMQQRYAVESVKALVMARILQSKCRHYERGKKQYCPYNSFHLRFELMWTRAAYDSKNYAILDMLLNQGFMPYHTYHTAAEFNDEILCQLLFKKWLEIDFVWPWGPQGNDTALHVAARCGSLNVAKLLVSHASKKKINALDDTGMTPLHMAIKANQMEMVKCLVQIGGNQLINQCPNIPTGVTPLPLAASNENIELLKFLVEQGADVNLRDSDGSTLLHVAAMSGSVEVLKFLLDPVDQVTESLSKSSNSTVRRWTADINIAGGIHHITPLVDAARSNQLNCFSYLLDAGAVDDISNLMYWACKNGSVEVVKVLLRKETVSEAATGESNMAGSCGLLNLSLTISTEIRDDHDDWTPLTISIMHGHTQLVKFLLEAGCSINVCTTSGRSPFYCAVMERGNIPLGKSLLARGVDVNTRLNDNAQAPAKAGFLPYTGL
ncbi:hypothetical protein HDU76_004908 [Blyttiomyces sp. JEL0837]|nr:hypothetical protein HDU76_004908 [Blyttiomyces sp. JEL0837]